MKFTLPLLVILGLSLSALYVSAQSGCSTAGQAAYINSTADYQRFSQCSSLPGIVFGYGDLTGSVTLNSLTTITNAGGNGFGIVIQGCNLTSLSFPNLANFNGNQFRFIDNLQLVSVSTANSVTVDTSANVEIVFQNNPQLSNVTLGFNNLYAGAVTVGGGSVQGLDGLVGTLNFPSLTSTTGDIRITNNGLNSGSAGTPITVNFPVLTNSLSLIVVNNTIANINIPASFTNTNGITVTGNRLGSNSFNVNTVSTPSMQFANNLVPSGSNAKYSIVMNNLKSVASDITIQENNGLSSISFGDLQYSNGALNVLSNPDLTNFYMPNGLIMNFNGLTFNGNGGNNGAAVNAVIGLQNTTSALGINGNTFASLVFSQLQYVASGINIGGNTINGPFILNTTTTSGSDVSITGNGGAATIYDLSGLANVQGNLNLNSNNGNGQASLLLTQLYVVAGSVSMSSNKQFGALRMGNLGFISTLVNGANAITYTAGSTSLPSGVNGLTIGENDFTSITTGSATSNAWSTNVVSITNNPSLTNITLGGLAQAAYLTVTGNNVLTTLIANQLSCLGVGNIAGNDITNVQLSALKSSNQFQISNAQTSCGAQVGGVTSSTQNGCTAFCFTCGNGATPCNNAGLTTQLKSAQCGQNGNVFASGASCTAVNFASYTTTGATLTPSTVPANNGGNGGGSNDGGSNNGGGNGGGNNGGGNGGNPATTTYTGPTNNNPATTTTPSNSNAFTTTVNPSGNVRGNGNMISASFVLLGFVFAFLL